MKKDIPLVSDHRLLEIIRSVTRADVKWWELDDKDVSRPDMNGEDNLLKLARLVADEAKARIPLWRLEQNDVDIEAMKATLDALNVATAPFLNAHFSPK